jgi:hypothetical protein
MIWHRSTNSQKIRPWATHSRSFKYGAMLKIYVIMWGIFVCVLVGASNYTLLHWLNSIVKLCWCVLSDRFIRKKMQRVHSFVLPLGINSSYQLHRSKLDSRFQMNCCEKLSFLLRSRVDHVPVFCILIFLISLMLSSYNSHMILHRWCQPASLLVAVRPDKSPKRF